VAEHNDITGYIEIFGSPFWSEKSEFNAHAFISGVSSSELGTEISLEITEAQSFERLLEEFPENARALFEAASSSSARIQLAPDADRIFGFLLEDAEGQWLTLSLDRRKSGTELRLLTNFADQEGTAYYVQSVHQTPKVVVAAHSLPLGTIATASDILEILKDAQGTNLEVAMLDVGQGASAFIYERQTIFDQFPLLYFDLGGGTWKNAFTNPVGGVHWCFSKNPPIILSHWHEDHYAGATYGGTSNVMKATKATWIGPARPTGTHVNKFKSRVVTAGGKIYLWPLALPAVTVGPYTLGLANGTSCNDSGLVLLVESPVNRFTLLPGDASYHYIDPYISKKYVHGLRTLIATHHAGAFKGAFVPSPDGLGGNQAVFSAGPGNSYGHPSSNAQHAAAGWNSLIGTDNRQGLPVRHRQASTGGITRVCNFPACGGGGSPMCSLRLYL
jgi:beta-lactamase superfamily II metal-dependent hydrolase